MIGPDQDLSDFPVWLWPYIDVARLAEVQVSQSSHASVVATPALATVARLSAFIAAATIKRIAGQIKDPRLQSELVAAASSALAADVDEFCGTPPHKWPWPHSPLQLEISELAGNVALAAAASINKGLSGDLGQVANRLNEQSQRQRQ